MTPWLHQALANGPELRELMASWRFADIYTPRTALVGPDGFTPVGLDLLVPRQNPVNDN